MREGAKIVGAVLDFGVCSKASRPGYSNHPAAAAACTAPSKPPAQHIVKHSLCPILTTSLLSSRRLCRSLAVFRRPASCTAMSRINVTCRERDMDNTGRRVWRGPCGAAQQKRVSLCILLLLGRRLFVVLAGELPPLRRRHLQLQPKSLGHGW
eukprot:3054792-Pleurochrysis_carterae.AAC.2